MKTTLMMILAITSLNAFAAFNELECEGKFNGSKITIEIEEPFPTNSIFRDMTVTLHSEGSPKVFNYSVTSRRYAEYSPLLYVGANMKMSVDVWPDSVPRWGKTYWGSMLSRDFSNQAVDQLRCTFPNIF